MESRQPLQTFTPLNKESGISLPSGMSLADWTVEKIRWQNPRIRALLGCIRLLGGVLESNYAILHCSPERLLEIWRKVRQVSDLIRTEIRPLMSNPSRFPDLEAARQRTELALDMLLDTVLEDLDRFPSQVPHDQLIEVRKLLCVSIGKMHSFLQDAFGEIMANDPRSSHDADYFLSKRFPQDLDEAEWLHSTVHRLRDYLASFDEQRNKRLTSVIAEVGRDQTIPVGSRWEDTALFLEILVEVLTPKLKEVLALRGIRFYEMEILDRYAVEIPTQCRILHHLYEVGRQTVEDIKRIDAESRAQREHNVQVLMGVHKASSLRLVELMTAIDKELRDLVAFVPIWLESIGNRRALLLKRSFDDSQGGESNPLDHTASFSDIHPGDIHPDETDTAELQVDENTRPLPLSPGSGSD